MHKWKWKKARRMRKVLMSLTIFKGAPLGIEFSEASTLLRNACTGMGPYPSGTTWPASATAMQSIVALIRGIKRNAKDVLHIVKIVQGSIQDWIPQARQQHALNCKKSRTLTEAFWKIWTDLPKKEVTAVGVTGTTRYTQALLAPAVACSSVLPVSSNRSPGPMALSARYQRPLGSSICIQQQTSLDIQIIYRCEVKEP